jgi:hypothetical protein
MSLQALQPLTLRNQVPKGRCNHSQVKVLTNRILDLIAGELNQPETQAKVRSTIIEPLIKLLYGQMAPYVMGVCAVILVILLTSLCTCTMFALFFFKGR